MRAWLRWSDSLLIAFAILAIGVAIIGTNSVDLRITLALQHLTSADAWFRAASRLGGEPVNIVAPIIAIFALGAVAWWREAVWLTASVVGETVLQHASKLVVGRVRPGFPVRVEELTWGSSFPSGHVMEYLALFGFLIVIVSTRLRPSVMRTIVMIALIALCCVIGPSRVYLGAHWTTDVIGAYLIGLWWLSVCARGYHGTLRRA